MKNDAGSAPVAKAAATALLSLVLVACTTEDPNNEVAEPTPTTSSSSASSAPPTTVTSTPVRTGMIRIPAGVYPLGANSGPASERPANDVRLKAFQLDRFPVTTAEFVAWANRSAGRLTNVRGGEDRRWDGPLSSLESNNVRDRNGREIFTTDDGDEDSRMVRVNGRFAVEPGFGDHPVSEVFWWGASLYCVDRGARLPTEAEWEAAARGMTGRAYPWGDQAPDASRAQYGQGYGETAPVTAHPGGATPEGVQDLVGNLYEWTSSLDMPYPYRADDGRESQTSNDWRITRGSSHDEPTANLRPTDRDGYSRDPFAGHHHIGFRCAADAT